MGWYGTLVLARPTTAGLPAQPEVRQAFGSRFATPTPWGNKLGLYDLGQGWQRGFSSATELLPEIDPDDPAFGDHQRRAALADIRAARAQYLVSKGWEPEPDLGVTPQDLDQLRFRDLLWRSVYGGGASRDELVARYEQLIGNQRPRMMS